MKKALTIISILVFSLSISTMPAQEKVNNSSQMTEIIGKVISVRLCYLKIFSGSLTVKDEKGMDHIIKASSKILEGIRTGDSVYVKVEDGKAKSIIKLWRSG